MSSGGTVGVRARRARVAASRWSVAAWGAIAVTALFVAVTCWWLTQDRSVPFGGGAQHLYGSIIYYEFFREGRPLHALNVHGYYPPGLRLFGALALFVGGMSPAAPIVAQNLVFVPLLALACYRIGRLLAGPRAGLLAVVFALGSPLMIEQFHTFMLDAPQAALVAVAVWLILASERFARVDLAALAGLVVALGLLEKQLMPLYLVGLLAATLLRGQGWRNWRGIAAFAGVILLVAGPWYVGHHADWSKWIGAAGTGSEGEPVPPAAAPPLLSDANLTWYAWATLNGLLFAALSAFAAIGVVSATARVVRERPRPATDLTVDVLIGLAGAWLAITLLRHHDARYTMSLVVFLAVLGTAWIVRLRPAWQAGTVALLVAAVVVANLGATFGVGRSPDQRPLSNGATQEGEGVPPRDRVIAYSSLSYLISSPERNGDLLSLFHALHATGVRRVAWQDHADVNDHLFDTIGLIAFARMSGLDVEGFDPPHGRQRAATLIRDVSLDSAEPCARLMNGSAVWIRFGRPEALGARDWCPRHHPVVYGP